MITKFFTSIRKAFITMKTCKNLYFYILFALPFFFTLNLFIASSQAHETYEHRKPYTTDNTEKARIFNIVSTLLAESKFDELEKLVVQYRNKNERSPSGKWNLTHFYESLYKYWEFSENIDTPEMNKKRRNETISKWIEQFPNSPTPYLAHAIMHRALAWKTRGWGYANTVKQEAWAPFYNGIRLARKVLEKHKDVASKDPHWYKLRINSGVELGEKKNVITSYIFEGINKAPHYYPIHFAAVGFYTPKWRGDATQIPALANLAVKLTEKSEGQTLYARIYWAAIESRDGDQVLFSRTMSWNRMKKGMDDVVAKYPDNWNINNFLYFSCVKADKQQAQKLISIMEGDPIMSVWGKKELFEECKHFAMAN